MTRRPDPDLDALFSAAARALAKAGPEAIDLEAIAAEAGVPSAELEKRYGRPKVLLKELVVQTFSELADNLEDAVVGARSGSEAITRFIEGYVDYCLHRLDRFRAAVMMRQIWGNAAVGLTEEVDLQATIAAVRRGVDPLERALLKDRAPSDRAGGINPRRLAFAATIVAAGFCTLRGLTQERGFSHDDRDLVNEITGALGTATTTLRHLSALNEVSTELARIRTEEALSTAFPRLLAEALELEESRFVLAVDGGLPEDVPWEARTAFTEDRVAHAEATGDDDPLAHVLLAAPVRIEGKPVGALMGRLIAPRLTQGHIARFETFATMAGLALENVRFYENLQALVDARTHSLRQAQAALVHSEKMAAMGTLVAGLAHEINTPMGSVVASQDTLSRALTKLQASGAIDPKAERLAGVITNAGDTIREGTRRISEILETLKRFSRLDGAAVDYADLNASVRDTLQVVHHRLPATATVVTELGDLPKVKCSPAQIGQVFLAILQNAIEAIDEAGTIRVVTSASEERVLVEISDDGPGIAPANLSKVFDPGFTTKGVGVGAGMGLSICHRIVGDHGGTIRVRSEGGTTVAVELPLDR